MDNLTKLEGNLARLETLNEEQHLAGDALYAARRALVAARARASRTRGAELAATDPAARATAGRAYTAAVQDQAEAADAARSALEQYIAALDAFFAELDR